MGGRRRRVYGFVSGGMLIAGVIAPSAVADATSLLWVGGTSGTIGKVLTTAGFLAADAFGSWDTFLAGMYRDDQHINVDYPASLWPLTGLSDPSMGDSIAIGVARLEAMIRATPGPLVIAGGSQGAMVIQAAEADLAGEPAVPPDTTFVLIADPNLGLLAGSYGKSLAVLDYIPQPLAQTRFRTIVVTCEYDGFARPIAQPANLLTVLNALMGLFYIHPLAVNSDLSSVPQANISTTVNSLGGITTTYLVPAQQLPLTMPLRQIGIPQSIVDGLDTALRPLIDSGYARPGVLPLAKTPIGVRVRPKAPRAVSRRDRWP